MYTIFTSGSTGRPKGVMTSHENFRNVVLWKCETLEVNERDVMLLKTPYAYVASVREIFAPLITGATLVIARPGGERESAYLADLIPNERISVLCFVPSMLEVFLEATGSDVWKTVTRVVSRGEALSGAVCDAFFAKSKAQLINNYGCSEATSSVCAWRCLPGATESVAPIGRPIANMKTYVLDDAMQPVPVGVVGELYLGGAQVTKGYVSQPDLTAERFLPNPFGDPDTRLYKTGDRVRYRTDGVLEFAGRTDNQVHLRGVRIELGEIEASLAIHPQVARCAVATRMVADTEQLVGYVVSTEGEIDKADLQAHLAEMLPGYMVPSFFVQMDELPFNTSGKLDRKALPTPEQSGEGQRVPATTPAEIALAEIWCELLGVDEVGITDDFFALGGHSLLITRMLSFVVDRLGVSISVAAAFGSPTIQRLALLVGEVTEEGLKKQREQIAEISDDDLTALWSDDE